MNKRSLMLIVMLSATATQADARGPFGWRSSPSRPANPPAQPSTMPSQLRGVLQSPEQMTRLYGPSILVRPESRASASASDNRFVVQPDA